MEIFKQKENLLIFQGSFLEHCFQLDLETAQIVPDTQLRWNNFGSQSSCDNFYRQFSTIACGTDQDKIAASGTEYSFTIGCSREKLWYEDNVLWALALVHWNMQTQWMESEYLDNHSI